MKTTEEEAREYFANKHDMKINIFSSERGNFILKEDVIKLAASFANAKAKALLEEAAEKITAEFKYQEDKEIIQDIILSLIPKEQ